MGGMCQDGTVGEPNGNPVSPRLFSSVIFSANKKCALRQLSKSWLCASQSESL